MSDELFPVADVSHESPRLAWLKRHRVETHHLPLAQIDGDEPWRATTTGRAPHQLGDRLHVGTGETEHDAIADLADLLGVPLWNEEEFAATTAQKLQNEKP